MYVKNLWHMYLKHFKALCVLNMYLCITEIILALCIEYYDLYILNILKISVSKIILSLCILNSL